MKRHPSQPPQPPCFALLTWRKTGPLRFLGHLDVVRTFSRALRRAGLPVVYSQGFNPALQISFASALPVGTAGESELCALQLAHWVPPEQVRLALNEQLPADLAVLDVQVMTGSARNLFARLSVARYRVDYWPEDASRLDGLDQAVDAVLRASNLPVARQTKTGTHEIDIRRGIYHLQVLPSAAAASPGLLMALDLRPQSMVKPGEVLQCLAACMTDPLSAELVRHPRLITRLSLHQE